MMTLLSCLLVLLLAAPLEAGAAGLRIASFSADVTVPLGHRLMGVLPVKSKEIVDPLLARGFVLEGAGEPIVLVAVDWCELRNRAHDRWRNVLAEAAGTTRERVLVSAVHQHDAPVVDLEAEELLASAGLGGELCDVAFHEQAVQRAAAALRESLGARRRVTHIGVGRARVEKVACNRRVVRPDGGVSFDRSSSSGGQPFLRDAPEGLIDPWLRTLSFWDGDTPLVALHAYATHPMSYYGRGGVSADFVGLARRSLQEELPAVMQIYVSGPSGDVTAGKYNDGSVENRPVLAERLASAMRRSWRATRRVPLGRVELRSTPLSLAFQEGEAFTAEALERTLREPGRDVRDRILAAMGLSTRRRLSRGAAIDLPCLDLGAALVVLFPGESFVGYQIMAQRMRPDVLVLSIGYGDGWPGYIPTRSCFEEGFGDDWRWVAPGAETRIREALWRILPGDPPRAGAESSADDFARDVYPATTEHPRFSEGSIIELADGSILYAATAFLAGTADDARAHIIARRSTDGGRTWGPSRVLQENVGERNVMSVTLRRFRTAGQSGIGMFYLVKNAADDLRVHLRVSEDEASTFGPPILVTRGEGYHVMNNDRVLQLLGGRLLCPVAWTRDARRENHYVSFCCLSDDGGRTWRDGSGRVDLPRRGAMEPEVVELRDGRLLMIVRTQLGAIHASTSTDGGDRWSEPTPWGVPSPESPATLRRIPSTGDLLLVWNPLVVEGAGHGGPRTPLAAAISADEGKTWSERRLLESRADQTYAYTSAAFVGERVLLSYYVRDETTGWISSRFRSIPLGSLYGWR
ncbi:MAG: exo-alpha-sialidase [Planctomycetes bacterium]|nr:exo-alpha-sialidase [Planctomycetota bacterium]